MTTFFSSAKIATSAVMGTAPISPARNTVTKPTRTASRPIRGDEISWTNAAGVRNNSAVISALAPKPSSSSAIDGIM